jgi:hypothetical protein
MPSPWNRDGNAIAPADFFGTTNNMPVKVRTNDVERLRIGVTGNVGIGTTNPASPLHVAGDRIQLESGGRRLILRSDGVDVDVQSDTNHVFVHSSAPGGRNNVVINPFEGEGNVGVGTAAPATKLHVVGERIQLESGGRRLLLRSDGADVDVQSETSNVFIHSSGPRGRNNVVINPFGNEGNVGIGTGTPATKLEVAGDIRANDVFVTSDVRFKSDIAPLTGALAKLLEIRGVSFTRVNHEDTDPGGPRRLGVIAQEVEPVMPELVDRKDGAGSMAVNYAGLIAVLIEAIKELAEANAGLRGKVERLEMAITPDDD